MDNEDLIDDSGDTVDSKNVRGRHALNRMSVMTPEEKELVTSYLPRSSRKYLDLILNGKTVGQVKEIIKEDLYKSISPTVWDAEEVEYSIDDLVNSGIFSWEEINEMIDDQYNSEDGGFTGFIKRFNEPFESAVSPYTANKKREEEAKKNDPKTLKIIPALIGYRKQLLAAFEPLNQLAMGLQVFRETKEKRAQLEAEAKARGITIDELILEKEFALFGNFRPASDFKMTSAYVREYVMEKTRANTQPAPIEPYQCRIGLSTFYVPPTAISVDMGFQSGSMSAGAIRQFSPPRFNSGHSETIINMSLIFPNDDQIWGFPGRSIEIDFEKDGSSDEVIDRFASSLRGLITQFRYAPFLPIDNVYLNRTYGIKAVALQSMVIQTIPNFPFALQVELTLLKFNYEVYLPMVNTFNDAIHWGKFRQYIGRGAKHLSDYASKSFILSDTEENPLPQDEPAVDERTLKASLSYIENDGRDYVHALDKFGSNPVHYRYTWDKKYEWLNGKYFDIFYPDRNPAPVVGPSVSNFITRVESDAEGDTIEERKRSIGKEQKAWWEDFLTDIGFLEDESLLDDHEIIVDNAAAVVDIVAGTNISRTSANTSLRNEAQMLMNWLRHMQNVLDPTVMGPGVYNELLDKRIKEYTDVHGDKDEYAILEIKKQFTAAWFAVMYNAFLQDPKIQAVLQYQQRRRNWIAIREWDIPMKQLGLDHNNIIVTNVAVNLANNIAKLQLQMQAEPVYQHIGGLGVNCTLKMIVFGEEELLKLQQAFETINGLARIEHGHAVLGFFGFKNVVTALAGMKYAIPLNMTVDTVEGYPHVYNVILTLADFDVFQQKREQLSTEQQADLIESFGKRNPFLRIQQKWGAFNAYPDFPLDVRDENGNIVGHLDPDFYFNAFQAIEDDIVEWRKRTADPNDTTNHYMRHYLGAAGTTGQVHSLVTSALGVLAMEGEDPVTDQFLGWDEATAANVHTRSKTSTSFAPLAKYQQPYADGRGDPLSHFDYLMKDAQYRDKSGRMIRAFPTYMLWIIDEGGNMAGVKLFDNLYGLQNVIDFSVLSSEDSINDTLVLRLSNLYSRLSTEDANQIDPALYKNAALINNYWNTTRNMASGFSDYLVKLDTVNIRPGVRIHLRAGYSANPNALETVFNGVISEVETGEIVTIIASSDAIELSAIVNNKNKDGDTGKIDGALLSGWWMSEPRDLMVRLLTMGHSVFREHISAMYRGMIFSENRYGIRHFGSMLYEPMGPGEVERHRERVERLRSAFAKFQTVAGGGSSDMAQAVGSSVLGTTGGIFGLVNVGMADLGSLFQANYLSKRDYELFKRNIYPGNGLGIAQYLGGDIGDGGPGSNFYSTGITTEGTFVDPRTGESLDVNSVDPAYVLKTFEDASSSVENRENSDWWSEDSAPGVNEGDTNEQGQAKGLLIFGLAGGGSLLGGPIGLTAGLMLGNALGNTHVITDVLGLTKAQKDDDLETFDEVSFRAQTYMKSVWDIFRLCAALLPNYIVAVRPFMDRSTIFYGKPHWMYTSGVIPISTGLTDKEAQEKGISSIVEPDEELTRIQAAVEEAFRAKEQPEDLYTRLDRVAAEAFTGDDDEDSETADNGDGTVGGDPYASPFSLEGQEHADQLPTVYDEMEGASDARKDKGIVLPFKNGFLSCEMHLPTSGDLQEDTELHLPKSPGYMPYFRHPWYMDKAGGVRGGYVDYNHEYVEGTTILNESPTDPGQPGAFGYLNPEDEQYYCAMGWNYNGHKQLYMQDNKAGAPGSGLKILVYLPDTNRAVVCTPGDAGPDDKIGVSPDTAIYLANGADPRTIHGKTCTIGLVPDDTPVGPAEVGSFGVTSTGGPIEPGTEIDLKPDSQMQKRYGNWERNVPGWVKDSSLDYSALDKDITPFAFHIRYGWIDPRIPAVWTDPSSNVVDPVSKGAQMVYELPSTSTAKRAFEVVTLAAPFTANPRSIEDANSVWAELREFFFTDQEVIDVWNKSYPLYSLTVKTDSKNDVDTDEFRAFAPQYIQFLNRQWDGSDIDEAQKTFDDFEKNFKTKATENLTLEENDFNSEWQALTPFVQNQIQEWVGAGRDISLDTDANMPLEMRAIFEAKDWDQNYINKIKRAAQKANASEDGIDAISTITDAKLKYYQIRFSFLQFLWSHPYHRGWVVLTADAKNKPFREWADDTKDFLHRVPGLNAALSRDNGLATNLVGRTVDVVFNTVDTVTEVVGDVIGWLRGRDTAQDDRAWSFPKVTELFDIYINEGKDAAITYMLENKTPGMDYHSGLYRAGEQYDRRVIQPIAEVFKNLGASFSQVWTAILSIVRLGMTSLNYGLGMSSIVQQQATLTNDILNDSIYYQGIPGTLPYLVDNPFTREYGEPVVEIRQPFQRVHQLNSFQHILSNGIVEKSTNVSTVVTAVSGGLGSHPVTVYFDKGAPTERQQETVVETGLWWDKPTGLSKLIHPISLIRGWHKLHEGNADDISAKRVALWHLKENLQDIYDGEIVIIGDPSIRPYDMIYLTDVYERIYGFIEVEQVVHHFTPDSGFITSISPNAVVMINDPAKWSVNAAVHSAWRANALRDIFRKTFNLRSGNNRILYSLPAFSDANELQNYFEGQIENVVYTGGATKLMLDLADASSLGMLSGNGTGPNLGAPFGRLADRASQAAGPGVLSLLGETVTRFVKFKAFEWAKKNLQDQHGCYIMYLTKNGMPMDAGLSYNHGVAVGHQKTATLFGNALRIPTGGRITGNEILKNLGWHPQEISGMTENANWWDNQARARIQELVGGSERYTSSTDFDFLPPEVFLVTVEDIIDGDTFTIKEKNISRESIRLLYVNTPEIPHPFSPDDFILEQSTSRGMDAAQFTRKRLIEDVREKFGDSAKPTVVLRVERNARSDDNGRLLAYVFHTAPSAMSEEERNDQLITMASQWPLIDWRDYWPNGEPHTLNWELVVQGHADIDARLYDKPLYDAGFEGDTDG